MGGKHTTRLHINDNITYDKSIGKIGPSNNTEQLSLLGSRSTMYKIVKLIGAITNSVHLLNTHMSKF